MTNYGPQSVEGRVNRQTAADQRFGGLAPQNGAAAYHSRRFRRFEVIPGQRLLLCEDRAVAIGSRAFDLLVVLLEFRGTVVSTSELVRLVWRARVVDETNLRFQMASLRKVLGADRDVIKTIPRRGYLFTSDAAQPIVPSRVDPSTKISVTPEMHPRNRLIVVIDDDAATREALDGLLRSVGWQVETYASVCEFRRDGRWSVPDCFILDVCMPGRSGLEFQTDLTREGREVPVIFISGHADIPMSVRAMKAGAVEFLTKPVHHEDLLRAISSVVGPMSGELSIGREYQSP